MDPALIRDCVHCGFCLPSCPSYVVFNEEMDSPRGRIWLMQATVEGTIELNRTVAEHFDRCLGCMACLTSCPSGVKYDKLIELAREQVEEQVRRPWRERMLRRAVFAVFPHPKRLRTALRFSRLPAPGPFKPLKALAPTWSEPVSPPVETPAAGERLARVGLLTGCVQSVIFGEVNRASARVLSACGYEVTAPYAECCGALALHAGRRRGRARPGAAHGGRVPRRGRRDDRHQRRRLRLAPEGGGPRPAGRGHLGGRRRRARSPALHPLPLRVAYQEACHLGHAQRVRAEPRAMLRSIPELELVEPAEQEMCCGSAGIYNLVQPDAARTLGDRKAAKVIAAEPEVYASANPGCLVQVSAALRRAGRPMKAVHPVELLDASIRGTSALPDRA